MPLINVVFFLCHEWLINTHLGNYTQLIKYNVQLPVKGRNDDSGQGKKNADNDVNRLTEHAICLMRRKRKTQQDIQIMGAFSISPKSCTVMAQWPVCVTSR